jgi:hypothetical protein
MFIILMLYVDDNLEVIGYLDADFIERTDSHRSTSGYVFTLASGAISWRSCKQTITTSSTVYAEFIACYELIGQAMRLKNSIPSLRVVDSINKSLILHWNNKAIVFFSHNNKSSEAAKHIDLKYLMMRERVQDNTINLEHISTTKMLVDMLTKDLPSNFLKNMLPAWVY